MTRKWTPEEDARLKTLREQGFTSEEIGDKLNRSKIAIQHRFHRTGISTPSRKWTLEEDKSLRELVQTHSTESIAEMLDRSRRAITRRMQALKLTPHDSQRWSSWEIEQLKMLCAKDSTLREIRQVLPTRSTGAIRTKALRSGWRIPRESSKGVRSQVRVWTKKQDWELLNLLTRYGVAFIAKKMDRSEGSVRSRLTRLGVNASQGQMTLREVADLFGVTVNTVKKRRNKLDLMFRRVSGGGVFHSRGPSSKDMVKLCGDFLKDPPYSMSQKNIRDTRELLEYHKELDRAHLGELLG